MCLIHTFFILEDLSDSDDVFAKEITKWNSNDFLDTLERPNERDDVLGKRRSFLCPSLYNGRRISDILVQLSQLLKITCFVSKFAKP